MTVADLIQFCEAEGTSPTDMEIRLAFFDRTVELTTLDGNDVSRIGFDPDRMMLFVPSFDYPEIRS